MSLVQITVQGNLRDYMDAKIAMAETGVMKAVGTASRQAVMRLRQDVLQARLGEKVARTWRANVYPRSGRSLSPAAYIFSRAPTIISAFEAGVTITPRGRFLAVPIGQVARSGRGGNTKRLGARQVLDNYERVRWIPLKGRHGGYLVVAVVQKRAARGWAKRGGRSTSRSEATLPLFLMLPAVRLQKRLNIARIAQEIQDDWPELYSRALADAFRNEPAEGAA